MPRHEDHPVVVARLRAGISRVELARQIGVDRSTIAAIEEGRTKTMSIETATRIDSALHLRPGTVTAEMARWRADPSGDPRLTLQARAVLTQNPLTLAQQFTSFEAWRRLFAPNPTAFASMLGVNVATVARYERGIRRNGMPDSLASALMQKLNVSPQYVAALRALPPSEE